VNAVVTVDSNNLLGLLVPEDTGSTILSNVAICVFTKHRYLRIYKITARNIREEI
jgi:hypothetical protein